MPYIPPNSDVVLCRGVPIDSDYKNTLYFESVAEQNNYFFSKAFKQFHNVSYQRERRNVITLDIPATDVYACNYLLFKNTSYGEKWFFAFVNSVEYVNDNVTDIYYELDMMQTWMFQYTLKQCMVEREHSVTDKIFENTRPENIGYGELMCGVSQNLLSSRGLLGEYACVITSKPYSSGDVPIKLYSQFCPVYGYIGSAEDMNTLVQDFVRSGWQDAVLSVTVANALMAQGADETHFDMPKIVPKEDFKFVCYGVTSGIYEGEEQFKDQLPNGYKPRNKKLFGYPYNQLWVSNNQGTVNEYRYEDFKIDKDGFFHMEVAASGISSPECILYPLDYRGIAKYYDHALVLTGYPTVPWIGDTYKAYMAMNRNQIENAVFTQGANGLMNTVSAFLGGAMTVNNAADMLQAAKADASNAGKTVSQTTKTGLRQQATGGIFSAIGTAGTSIVDFMTTVWQVEAKLQDVSNIPPNVGGLSGAGSVTNALARFDYSTYYMCVKPEYAEIVDKFFDMFGYNTCTVKVPNTHSRPHWNYVKTIGCDIQGFLPQEAANIIKAVYDKGVTFWKNGDEVGNYTLDNSPT
jgi:hypothetical protein|nr:MAG TPA: Major tail protein [Caudoviricetes sp.]